MALEGRSATNLTTMAPVETLQQETAFFFFPNTSMGNISLPEPDIYDKLDSVLRSYVIGTICVLGLLGNILNLIVLSRKSLQKHMERMEKSAHMGLIALAMSDFLFCLCTFPQSWTEHISAFDFPSINFWLVMQMYGAAVINIFLLSSTWLTVFMAVSRYIAICHPFRVRQGVLAMVIGPTGSRITIILIFILSVLFNLPRFWEYQVGEFWGNYYCDVGPMKSDPYKAAEIVYAWLYFIIGIFVPLVMLAYSNIYLIRALKESSKMRLQHTRTTDRSAEGKTVVTLTLTIIVIFYILLVLPSEILTFFKRFVSSTNIVPKPYNLAAIICNTLQAVNFAFNFVLYCVINANFRKTIRDILTCKQDSGRRIQYSSVNSNGLCNSRMTLTTSIHLSRSVRGGNTYV